MKNVLFQGINFDYEEGYEVSIFEENNKYFVNYVGHNVMCGDYDETREVSHDEALEIMIEEIDNENTDYLGIDYIYMHIEKIKNE